MWRRTFVFGLTCTLFSVACGRVPKLPALRPGSTVLAFGDSVTFGTGAGPGEDWPSLLAATTRWNVVNAGIPSDTAEAAVSRIDALLDEHRPVLVIVEMGGNDFLHRRAQSAVKEDLRRIIRAAKAAGAQVVLVAVPELSLFGVVAGKASDSPIYEQLGKEEKVQVIGDVFSDILSRPALRADKIHPNASGYRQMAAGIFADLKAVGLAPAH